MSGPLAGVRILELASVVLGPWACQMLGDMGADVVKIEPPAGDSNRHAGPARHPLMAALFLTCNRNKRSVVLDLKQERGRAALLKLAAGADVVVHNYRPPAMARLGLSYEILRAVNPRLIVCGSYGYSRRGLYGDRPAYDDSIQAACGMVALQEAAGGDPTYVPTILVDKTTAMAVVSAVTAALYHRERTGEGQEIEVPMFETMISFLAAEHLFGLTFEPREGSGGYPRVLSRQRGPYRTKDGYLAILPYLDEQWRTFCHVATRPELAVDPRFCTLAARLENIDALGAEIQRVLETRRTDEWLDALRDTTIPATTVRRLDDLLADEHLAASGFWTTVEHPSEGTLRLPGVPVSFSRTPGDIRRLPPRLGEHSLEVLRNEARLTEEDISEMLRTGATRVPDGER